MKNTLIPSVGIEAGGGRAMGITKDGKVVFAGSGESASDKWENVSLIAGDGNQIIILTQDGSLHVTESYSEFGEWVDLKQPK